MDNEKIGRFIAERRREIGMTQLELASRLHITDKAVSKWERGLSSPDIALIAPLADVLGVSVSDLLRGERTSETVENADVGEVLRYAEATVQKRDGAIKLWLSAGFTALLIVGIIVCTVVDVAINRAFTWSLYPISSVVFAWCVLFPMIRLGKKGVVRSLVALTILIVPYLLVLDRISGAEGVLLKAGAAVSAISLAYLWGVYFIMKRSRRKLIGAGVSTILAAPVCALINGSLALVLTPQAGVFDVWDALSVVILIAVGAGLVAVGFFTGKRR